MTTESFLVPLKKETAEMTTKEEMEKTLEKIEENIKEQAANVAEAQSNLADQKHHLRQLVQKYNVIREENQMALLREQRRDGYCHKCCKRIPRDEIVILYEARNGREGDHYFERNVVMKRIISCCQSCASEILNERPSEGLGGLKECYMAEQINRDWFILLPTGRNQLIPNSEIWWVEIEENPHPHEFDIGKEIYCDHNDDVTIEGEAVL